MDSLVEAITELVMAELAAAKSQAASEGTKSPTSGGTKSPASDSTKLPVSAGSKGPRVLVVSTGEPVGDEIWATLSDAGVVPVCLLWDGFRQEQLPAALSGGAVESRKAGWTRWVSDYRALCLVGSDLPTLGSLAALGAGGNAAAAVTIAALSSGLPVFCETSSLEQVRRHSARLAPGLTRVFEDAWRTVASFGVQFGQPAELSAFLSALSGGKAATAAAAKSGGRDVVTTEDVEAVRRAGGKTLSVGMGAIVTPLARQQASEWGIEVKFL